MARRRGVRGEAVSLWEVLAVNVNFGCDKSVELADSGGVKVCEGVRELKSGCGVMTETGVSGYEIANGPGVLVRCAGGIWPSTAVTSLVSSRREIGLASEAGFEPATGFVVAGEGVMAAA